MRQFKCLAIKQYKQNSGLTLIELLIALCLFALIVVAFSSIDTFSRYHLMSSDRRVKLQNDVSYILEHMAKEISKAIGNRGITGQNPIDLTNIAGDTAIKVCVDGNPYATPVPISPNGRWDANDRQIAYRYRTSGNLGERYQFWYYAVCSGPNCNQSGTTSHEVLSSKISDFTCTSTPTDNYVDIQVTACWDPATAVSPYNGTPNNPCVTMHNRIDMPGLTTN